MRFATHHSALAWANVHAREHCHAFHTWRVIEHGRAFRVAVFSRNTGAFSHFA
jgi:hypothetical protein